MNFLSFFFFFFVCPSLSVQTPLNPVAGDCPTVDRIAVIVSRSEPPSAIPHPDSFCEGLCLDLANGCFFFFSRDPELERRARAIGRESCGWECDPVPVELRRLTEVESAGGGGDGKRDRGLHVSPAQVAVSIPGAVLLCCLLICPCFRAKPREEEGRVVLQKEPNSMNSVSSFEVRKTSENFPSSPHRIPPNRFLKSSERIPGSPQWVPPSPSRVPPSPSRFSLSPQLNRVGSMHLSVSQIMKATHSFSPSLMIGEGGFGAVYKAELPGGQVVAIKRAKKENIAALRTEFSNEVELLAKIDHLNLVKLLGYVEKGNERIIITEYVTNGTLREHLDGLHGVLDFNLRLQIAIDVAHALTYLHLYAVPRTSFEKGLSILDVESCLPDPKAIHIAFKTYNDGNVGDILDPRLEETVDTEVLSRLLGLAFQCAAPTRSDRPTMQEVASQLWEIRKEFGASLRRE
ncbi:Calmodulin-binding receptor-like cytoplasmic kinase 3 [Acorus gramineus]|uniref:Calmodulin-binding receptor-like cytoplasmic kinase 3 n=1 Tax=Acorus gramineus TaxID=55184 RepID=A0AAV9BIR4_ACOGR|nr:Calmodulin-binding receptor-like cytoplasmic kinase 3 [Acorus gramineus]